MFIFILDVVYYILLSQKKKESIEGSIVFAQSSWPSKNLQQVSYMLSYKLTKQSKSLSEFFERPCGRGSWLPVATQQSPVQTCSDLRY